MFPVPADGGVKKKEAQQLSNIGREESFAGGGGGMRNFVEASLRPTSEGGEGGGGEGGSEGREEEA